MTKFLQYTLLTLVSCFGFAADCAQYRGQVAINGLIKQHLQSKDIVSVVPGVDQSQNYGAVNYMLAEATDLALNLSDPIDAKLSVILDRDGPDMRASRGYKDFNDANIEVATRAWTLMHQHALKAIRERVDFAKPAVEEILAAAGVNDSCRQSVDQVFEGAKRMDSWAVKLLSSWASFPPAGLFEGTYSDIGSFEACFKQPENKFIGHTHYCSVTFKPVLPKRKDYDLVINKEPERLRRIFRRSKDVNDTWDNNDAFEDLIEHAQYHHFVYYKLGTCWPIQCGPVDVKKVAKLLGRRNIFISGPVKCFSNHEKDYNEMFQSVDVKSNKTTTKLKKFIISIWDDNNGIYIWKPYFNTTQKWAMGIILLVTLFIVFMTMIDLIVNRTPIMISMLLSALNANEPGKTINGDVELVSGNGTGGAKRVVASIGEECSSSDTDQVIAKTYTPREAKGTIDMLKSKSFIMTLVDDCSIITNTAQFFRVSEGQMRNDILCLNGIRCITMVWIIMTHTMLYNDWSAFGRTRQIENSLRSPLSQPFFNGSYLVDSFFLMSGLLSAFTAFRHCQGIASKFSSIAFILGRWLRLTPQILFASLIYIVLPSWSWGPHWYPIVGEYSENCVNNWWVNVLHMQAFFKTERMCNFVTWWISIDFFYHFFALAVIWIILLAGHRLGFASITSLVLSQVTWQAIRHYQLSLPPNIFSTIPQTGAMWTTMTLDFYWTPYAHTVPFAFGFYIGYLMALKKQLILQFMNPRRAVIGWSVSIFLLVAQSYSSYWWVIGEIGYTRLIASIFYTICPIIWASSVCWTIIACHHGYGGFINKILSLKVFVVLGKASYFIYLTHFIVLFLFYGNQSLLLEPINSVMMYVILGNIFMSTLLGIFLCIVYELPWLKQQRKLMKYV